MESEDEDLLKKCFLKEVFYRKIEEIEDLFQDYYEKDPFKQWIFVFERETGSFGIIKEHLSNVMPTLKEIAEKQKKIKELYRFPNHNSWENAEEEEFIWFIENEEADFKHTMEHLINDKEFQHEIDQFSLECLKQLPKDRLILEVLSPSYYVSEKEKQLINKALSSMV